MNVFCYLLFVLLHSPEDLRFLSSKDVYRTRRWQRWISRPYAYLVSVSPSSHKKRTDFSNKSLGHEDFDPPFDEILYGGGVFVLVYAPSFLLSVAVTLTFLVSVLLIGTMKKGLHPQMQWISYVTQSGRLMHVMMTKIHNVGKVYHFRARRQMAESVGQIARFRRRYEKGIAENVENAEK
ncbi:unnamed protein product [Citrullus colocynthis]|uniref:Uncharacterized protein n=1 Tax=Citrullus colocynthis TaxID=252529 RepID=A0ABP0Z1F7_9ROSI